MHLHKEPYSLKIVSYVFQTENLEPEAANNLFTLLLCIWSQVMSDISDALNFVFFHAKVNV